MSPSVYVIGLRDGNSLDVHSRRGKGARLATHDVWVNDESLYIRKLAFFTPKPSWVRGYTAKCELFHTRNNLLLVVGTCDIREELL